MSDQFFNPTATDLLKILDDEIDLIKTREERPGWTPYALLGSLAGVTWLMLKELESQSANIENVPTLFLSLALLFDNLIFLYHLISPPQKHHAVGTRFRWSSYLKENLGEVLFQLLRSSILLLCAIIASDIVWWPYVAVACSYYALSAIAAIVSIILTFRGPAPLPVVNNPARALVVARVLFSGAAIWSACGYFLSLLDSSRNLSFSDCHIGGLLLICVFLLHKLLQNASEPPLLSKLINIRRDFTFRRIALDAAVLQADIALTGMEATDILQDDIGKILDSLGQIESKINLARQLYQSAKAHMGQGDDFTQDKATKIRESLASSLKRLDGIQQLLDELEKRNERFAQRKSIISAASPEAKESADAVSGKAVVALQRVTHDVAVLRQEIASVYKQLRDAIDGVLKNRTTINERMKTIEKEIQSKDLSEEKRASLGEAYNAHKEELRRLTEKWPIEQA